MANQSVNDYNNQLNMTVPRESLESDKENSVMKVTHKPHKSLLRPPKFKLPAPAPRIAALTNRNQKIANSSGEQPVRNHIAAESADDGKQKKETKAAVLVNPNKPKGIIRRIHDATVAAQPKMQRRGTFRAAVSPTIKKTEYTISRNITLPVKQTNPTDVSQLCKTSKIRKTEEQRGYINADPNETPAPHSVLYNQPYLENNIVYLLEREKLWNKSYTFSLKKMTTVSISSRAIIVNWLLIIEKTWRSNIAAFFSALRMFDIVIQLNYPLDQVQLVGIVCMWVAHKNLSVYSHDVTCAELRELCKNVCTEEEIRNIEKTVLRTCNFYINFPDPITFLSYYIFKLRLTSATLVYTYSKYLLEVISLDIEFCGNNSSKMAAAAVRFALEILHQPYDWELLRGYPGFYEKESLQHIRRTIIKTLKLVQDINFSCNFVYRKYNSKKYLFLSEKIKKMLFCYK